MTTRLTPLLAACAPVLIGFALIASVNACDDGGTSTTCPEMPIIERHGEGGAVDPNSDADYRRWRADAIAKGCATPSGDPEDFITE